MIVIGTRAHGQQRRRAIPVMADVFHKSEWMEGGDDPLLSPTAFLVEQPPDTTLVPHFHRQNQFQLFVGGDGLIGREALQPVTVHYAGGYTGYGPLVAGPRGIQYFTIRPVLESGFIAVADGRDRMIRGPKRHARTDPIAVHDDSALQALTELSHQALIAPQADGLAVTVTCLPPHAAFLAEPVAASQGQFVFVLAGSLVHAGTELGRWEHLFISSDEPAQRLVAGKAGAQVVAMHTPPRDPVYQAGEQARTS